MAISNPADMSAYIVAMAGAARAAQATISTGADPMTISEFRFQANIAAEYSIESETDISLNIWRMSISQKVTIGYKAEWGLEIECKIIPTVSLDT